MLGFLWQVGWKRTITVVGTTKQPEPTATAQIGCQPKESK